MNIYARLGGRERRLKKQPLFQDNTCILWSLSEAGLMTPDVTITPPICFSWNSYNNFNES